MLSNEVFGPSSVTKASDDPDRLPPPPKGLAFGKLPEKVSPVTYSFSNESSAMLVPMSFPAPPR
jgi:hypothetical protein